MAFFSRLLVFVSLLACLSGYYVPASAADIRNSSQGLSDTLDVTHYALHLDILNISQGELAGYANLEVASKIDGLQTLVLELMQLQVDSVFVDNQKIADFEQRDNRLLIPLMAAVNAGQSMELKVYYQGAPYSDDWGGFYMSGEYAYNLGVGISAIPHNLGKAWFPCIDDFKDRALYEYFIRTEIENIPVCGGLLQGVEEHQDGTHTFHWVMNQSLPTYLASVAVGPYAQIDEVYQGQEGDIPIQIFVRPGDTAKVEGNFEHLKEILAIYETHWGPYPFDRVGYVGTARGAMEHAANVAYPNFTITGNDANESLYAHELAHMWFGNKVTCASAGDMWMNEGWAVFNELLYREDLYGEDVARTVLREKHKKVLQFAHQSSGDGSYLPLANMPEDLTYGETIYQKGGTVVQTLRAYLGDFMFFKAMQAFLEEYAFQPASIEDLSTFLTTYTGVNMADFFDNWVYSPGHPHYAVDSFRYESVCPGYLAEVYLKQRLKGRENYSNSNRFEITFLSADWEMATVEARFSGESGVDVLHVPFEPVAILEDFYDRTCDATTDYHQVIKSTGSYDFPETFVKLEVDELVDSAFVRVTHNWVAPDAMKAPVAGLTLSDYRYWKVDGIFPEGFSATGQFSYSKAGGLDDGILIDPNDSLLILYRRNAADDWHRIPFTKLGPANIGYIFVDHLQRGEYTLAVLDDQSFGIAGPDQGGLKIGPNPSSSAFRVGVPRSGEYHLTVRDVNGRRVFKTRFSGDEYVWEPGLLPAGMYVLALLDEDKRLIASQKVLWKVQ